MTRFPFRVVEETQRLTNSEGGRGQSVVLEAIWHDGLVKGTLSMTFDSPRFFRLGEVLWLSLDTTPPPAVGEKAYTHG